MSAIDMSQMDFRREEISVIVIPAVYACVECGIVSARAWKRCPVCEHGPENSRPTFKPIRVERT
jgi:hypothetical protein